MVGNLLAYAGVTRTQQPKAEYQPKESEDAETPKLKSVAYES